jgi:hypothetical protein
MLYRSFAEQLFDTSVSVKARLQAAINLVRSDMKYRAQTNDNILLSTQPSTHT